MPVAKRNGTCLQKKVYGFPKYNYFIQKKSSIPSESLTTKNAEEQLRPKEILTISYFN